MSEWYMVSDRWTMVIFVGRLHFLQEINIIYTLSFVETICAYFDNNKVSI